jgi:hypothetical protein
MPHLFRICTLPAQPGYSTCGSGACRRLWAAYRARKRRLRAEHAGRRIEAQAGRLSMVQASGTDRHAIAE